MTHKTIIALFIACPQNLIKSEMYYLIKKGLCVAVGLSRYSRYVFLDIVFNELAFLLVIKNPIYIRCVITYIILYEIYFKTVTILANNF